MSGDLLRAGQPSAWPEIQGIEEAEEKRLEALVGVPSMEHFNTNSKDLW